jgi:diadenosine tetraphosphate (Ap4A) HIT family hydrolase
VRHWYAQDPRRVEFDEASYVAEIQEKQCFICRLVQGDPGLHLETIVSEDDACIAFLDRFPAFIGHTLVGPKRHVEDLLVDLSREEYLHLQAFTYRIGQALSRVLSPERVYLCSFGSIQLNAHVHFHIIPLPPGVPPDGAQAVAMIRPVTGFIALSENERSELVGSIRHAMD